MRSKWASRERKRREIGRKKWEEKRGGMERR